MAGDRCLGASTRDHELLQTCAHADVGCLDRWVRATGLVAAYVYVPAGQLREHARHRGHSRRLGHRDDARGGLLRELRAALDAAGAQRVYAGDGAGISGAPPPGQVSR